MSYLPRINRPMAIHSRNDWESFEELEDYVKIAEEAGVTIAWQFQSLGDMMQCGEDITIYDLEKLDEMLRRIRRITGS